MINYRNDPIAHRITLICGGMHLIGGGNAVIRGRIGTRISGTTPSWARVDVRWDQVDVIRDQDDVISDQNDPIAGHIHLIAEQVGLTVRVEQRVA